MKITLGTLAVTGSLLLIISAFGYFFWYQPKYDRTPQSSKSTGTVNGTKAVIEALTRLKQKALQAKEYINDHRLDATHCFLLDMRIASGKNRFFVYNLEKDSVEMAGLVTHGSGSENGSEGLIFSNVPNSHSTSRGKYKIGNGYYGNFGLAYKLYGLDQSNSKAFERFIVVHAHECVPNEEVYPSQICLSHGCPTVSESFLSRLSEYITASSAPIMLWIYN